MSIGLYIRPSAVSKNPRKRWALTVRTWDGYDQPNYTTIGLMTDAMAGAIAEIKSIHSYDEEPPKDWRAELEALDLDEIDPQEMRLEIMRLRERSGTVKYPRKRRDCADVPRATLEALPDADLLSIHDAIHRIMDARSGTRRAIETAGGKQCGR